MDDKTPDVTFTPDDKLIDAVNQPPKGRAGKADAKAEAVYARRQQGASYAELAAEFEMSPTQARELCMAEREKQSK